MREWLTVIIILLIVGILLDGIRRMRQARRDTIKLSGRKTSAADKAAAKDTQDYNQSEFPSGGARVVGYREEADAQQLNSNLRETYSASRTTVGAPSRLPEQVALNLEQSVPMLMDSVDDMEEEIPHPEPQMGSMDDLADEIDTPSVGFDKDVTATSDSVAVAEQRAAPAPKPVSPPIEQATPQQMNILDEVEGKSTGESAKQLEPDEVIIINITAPKGNRFVGSRLLDALLSHNLRFGDMDIFHYHREGQAEGPILFSLANMVVPGTFDLAQMEVFETPGISLFMGLPLDFGDSVEAFNIMVEIASGLAKALGGDLKDENRSIMTSQTIEHARQRVVEFERKRLYQGRT